METVPYMKFSNYAKTCETKNLKKFKTSRTATTIINLCNDQIVEVRPEDQLLVLLNGWRKVMKERSLVNMTES